MLMNLPADSPLREDLLMIRKSGLRAAAVVQDLLNLARKKRGAESPLDCMPCFRIISAARNIVMY